MSNEVRNFEKTKIAETLREFLPWKRAAFMALVCERLLPNYVRFSTETRFGNVKILRDALNLIWSHVQTGNVPDHLEELKTSVMLQAPHTEQFVSLYTSAAVDAANAVEASVEALLEPTIEKAVEVAELSRDTVDLFIQEIEDLDPSLGNFEEKILSHPLMQREIRQQLDDLEVLSHWPEKNRHGIISLKPTETNGNLSFVQKW